MTAAVLRYIVHALRQGSDNTRKLLLHLHDFISLKLGATHRERETDRQTDLKMATSCVANQNR